MRDENTQANVHPRAQVLSVSLPGLGLPLSPSRESHPLRRQPSRTSRRATFATQESIGAAAAGSHDDVEASAAGRRATSSTTSATSSHPVRFLGVDQQLSTRPPRPPSGPTPALCALPARPVDDVSMADSEFEEFRHYFERLPQHLKAPLSNYT